MIEGTSKAFEEQFNTWYKTFLTEEAKMNDEIKKAKLDKQAKIEKAREEAKNTIKKYEAQKREELERKKDAINVEKNTFDKLDADFKNEVEIMRQKHKQNQDKVIKMLIENIFNVDLKLPANILQRDEEETKKKKTVEGF